MVFKHVVLLFFIGLVFTFATSESKAAKEDTLAPQVEISKIKIENVRALKKEQRSKAVAHYTMGIIYDNKGEVSLAIEEYKKSLKINPQSGFARLRLGVDYLILGDAKKAISEFETVKKIFH